MLSALSPPCTLFEPTVTLPQADPCRERNRDTQTKESGVMNSIPMAETETVEARPYPAKLSGRLDPQISRGPGLVKWLLASPHFVVLFFLWFAFAITTIIAWFAILFTGRRNSAW
jgi:hypothetical protein